MHSAEKDVIVHSFAVTHAGRHVRQIVHHVQGSAKTDVNIANARKIVENLVSRVQKGAYGDVNIFAVGHNVENHATDVRVMTLVHSC